MTQQTTSTPTQIWSSSSQTTSKDIPYQDKIGPSVPLWYAAYKYDPNKSFREGYIENALEPYNRSYGFYSFRRNTQIKMLKEAQELANKRAKKIKEREIKRRSMNWRKNVNYIL